MMNVTQALGCLSSAPSPAESGFLLLVAALVKAHKMDVWVWSQV